MLKRVRRNVQSHIVLRARSIVILTVLWLIGAAALEYLSRQQPSALRNLVAAAIATINAAALLYVVSALLKRLLEIINGQRGASLRDLAFIGFAYVFVIGGFATIYLAADDFRGESFFHSNAAREGIRLLDHLYFSGITIATVGYGDIVPQTWPTKFLVVTEAITGLWLTVIVLGVFIGNILGRQQQDRQVKFLTSFQKFYLNSLEDFHRAISSIRELQEERKDISDKEYEEMQRSLLETIATLVKLQYEPSPTAVVRSNWMLLYTGDQAPEKALEVAQQFTIPQLRNARAMKTLWGVLVMQGWYDKPSSMPGKGELALPVYDPSDPDQVRYQLTGAPQAVSNSLGYIIVSDSSNVDLSNQDESVRINIQNYFKEHAPNLRSFASVSIEYEGIGGVVNIQSDEPDLCGTSPEIQRLLVDMIRPFATYLIQLELYRSLREEVPASEEHEDHNS